MHAPAARASAPKAPDVTSPASAPVWRAITRLAASCSSSMTTALRAASCIASTASAHIMVPPSRVSVPAALTTGRTPSRS